MCNEQRSEISGKTGQNREKPEESLNRIKPLPVKAFALFSAGCGDQPEILPKQACYQTTLRKKPDGECPKNRCFPDSQLKS